MIDPVLVEPDVEAERVKCAVAFTLSGALELQHRLARDLDPELYRLLGAAHGRCLEVMAQSRKRHLDMKRKHRATAPAERTA